MISSNNQCKRISRYIVSMAGSLSRYLSVTSTSSLHGNFSVMMSFTKWVQIRVNCLEVKDDQFVSNVYESRRLVDMVTLPSFC